ncbi:MAG: putative signal transducing protein [Gemmataceae bacterium]
MTEKLVTVATYNKSFEAQLAKNLLEEEGIASTVSGDLTADMLSLGQVGGMDQIVLQVQESDAQRAVGILATVEAAKLADNWEEEAESGSDVWLCSICGEPISNRLSICYSCQTPRDSIRAAEPRQTTAIQPESETLPKEQGDKT